jgi:hypothetical protein
MIFRLALAAATLLALADIADAQCPGGACPMPTRQVAAPRPEPTAYRPYRAPAPRAYARPARPARRGLLGWRRGR